MNNNNKKKASRSFDRCCFCWVDLPQEILELIMKRLFYADLLNFGAVCKSWNSISRGRTVAASKQSPWLLMFERVNLIPPPGGGETLNLEMLKSWERNRKGCSCKLFDPVYKKTYTINNNNINLNLFLIQDVYASKHGWILSSAKYLTPDHCSLIFAYTPFSNVNNFIKLPYSSALTSSCRRIEFATFTSNPSSSITTEENCYFLVLHDSQSCTHDDNKYVTKSILISTCLPGDTHCTIRSLRYNLTVSESNNNSYKGGDQRWRWIYSQGNIYYIVHLRNRNSKQQPPEKQIRIVRVVKWESIMKSLPVSLDGCLMHPPLYGSIMSREEYDDDLLSKLEKEDHNIYPCRPAGTEYESCNIYPEYDSSCKMLKINPPHY